MAVQKRPGSVDKPTAEKAPARTVTDIEAMFAAIDAMDGEMPERDQRARARTRELGLTTAGSPLPRYPRSRTPADCSGCVPGRLATSIPRPSLGRGLVNAQP